MKNLVARPFEAVSVSEVVPPWGGRLRHIIRTDITKEWFITIACQTYLLQCPQTLSKCTYLCRSVDLLLNNIQEEESVDRLLREAGQELPDWQIEVWRFEERRAEEDAYFASLVDELDAQAQQLRTGTMAANGGNGPAAPMVAAEHEDNHGVIEWKEFIEKEAKRQNIGPP